MQASDDAPVPPPAISTAVPSGAAGDSPVVPPDDGRRTMVTLLAGLVAGLAAWVGGELCLGLIKPPLHPMNSRGMMLKVTYPNEEAAADAKNAGLAFLILGAALGAALGLAGGLARRSPGAALKAGLLGLMMGAGAGALVSLAVLPPYNAYKARNADEALRDLVTPLFLHMAIWSSIGAVSGLAFGLGLGARFRLPVIVQAALAGAALGAVIYELVGALAFPTAQTARFVSTTWQTRLFARLAVTLLTAAAAALAAKAPGSPAKRPLVPSP
jgi:hypothetical protein